MKDQNTEVLLLAQSAQVFVGGKHLGEYGGVWEPAGKVTGQKPAAAGRGAPAPSAAQAPPVPAQGAQKAIPAASPGNSKAGPPAAEQGAAFEQTLAPADVAQKKSLPPPRKNASQQGGPPPGASPSPAPAERPASRQPEVFQTPAPEVGQPTRARKPEGLDKSAGAMQKLVDAAKASDVAKVNECLAAGTDPDGPAKDGKTPLMAAVGAGSVAVVEALLKAFADPTLGKGDETPMTIAFQKGNQDILKVLFGASFNSLNGVVGGVTDVPLAVVRSDNQDVPENAMTELRCVTQMIASQCKEKPASPEHKHGGNYATLLDGADTGDKDSEMLRTEAIKMTMKGLSRTTKAGQ